MIRPLIKGDRVRLSYDPTRQGVVVTAGPDQSLVRVDGVREPLIFVNTMLVRIVERIKSRRNVR